MTESEARKAAYFLAAGRHGGKGVRWEGVIWSTLLYEEQQFNFAVLPEKQKK
jgi:hypothetical protein